MDIDRIWEALRPLLVERRERYSWPPGCTLDESLRLRDYLERGIKLDLAESGRLSYPTFMKVMFWGFGKVPRCVTEAALEEASEAAYLALREDRLAEASRALTALPGVGISRASKLLALSDQASLGIYDSSAARALNSAAGEEVVPQPPRQGSDDPRPSPAVLEEGFVVYTNGLRALHERAVTDAQLAANFSRVCDVEIALFEPG